MRWRGSKAVKGSRWQLRGCAGVGNILDRALVGALLGVVALKVASGIDCAASAVLGCVAMLAATLTEEPIARRVAALQVSSGDMPARAALVETRMNIHWLGWASRNCKARLRCRSAGSCSICHHCRARGWGHAEWWWQGSLRERVDGLLHCVDENLLLSLQTLLIATFRKRPSLLWRVAELCR